MVKKPRLLIFHDLIYGYALLRDIIKRLAVVMTQCVFSLERSFHIKTIEPDLPWIYLLMPVDAAFAPRLCLKLGKKDIGSFSESLLPASIKKREESFSCIDLIEVILAFSVCHDAAILSDHRIIH